MDDAVYLTVLEKECMFMKVNGQYSMKILNYRKNLQSKFSLWRKMLSMTDLLLYLTFVDYF